MKTRCTKLNLCHINSTSFIWWNGTSNGNYPTNFGLSNQTTLSLLIILISQIFLLVQIVIYLFLWVKLLDFLGQLELIIKMKNMIIMGSYLGYLTSWSMWKTNKNSLLDIVASQHSKIHLDGMLLESPSKWGCESK